GAADLHDRPFAPAGAAEPEREDRSRGLDQRNSGSHLPAVLMKVADDGVRSATARLGSEPRREETADERAERREHEQQPRPQRTALDPRVDALSPRPQRDVPGEALEHQPLRELQRVVKERGHEPGRRAHEHTVEQRSAQELELERRRGAPQDAPELPEPRQESGGRFALVSSRHGPPRPDYGWALPGV